MSLSRNPEIQFNNDSDTRDRRIFEKASVHASQRTDSLGSEIERQKNLISYFSVYAVNDGYAGPVRLYSGPLQTVSYSVQGEGGFDVSVKYSGQD